LNGSIAINYKLQPNHPIAIYSRDHADHFDMP